MSKYQLGNIDVDPYGIYVDDEANNFLYKPLLVINVKKETINDLKLLKKYGFITEEEHKRGKESLKLGYANCFVSEKVGLIVEKLSKRITFTAYTESANSRRTIKT